MTSHRVLIAVLVVAGGCTTNDEPTDGTPPERVVMLSDLPKLTLRADFNYKINADQSRNLHVDLSVAGAAEPDTLLDGDVEYCPQLDDSTTISFGGVDGVVAFRGGWKPRSTGYECTPPALEASIPAGVVMPEATLVVRDDSREIRRSFGDVLAGGRAIAALGHTDWTFAVGETASFVWTPASDLNGTSALLIVPIGIEATRSAWTPTGIDVLFPAQLPTSGRLRFVVSGDALCGDDCSFHADQIIEEALTIAP